MMRFYQVTAAMLLCVWTAVPVLAQSAPAERPPAGFKGQQYVDSQGCVFLRAGYGGQVQWVQRITAARKPLCGYPPTFGAVTIDVAAPEQPTAPVEIAKPAAQVAAAAPVVQQPVRIAAPAVQAAVEPPALVQPAPQMRVAAPSGAPGPGKIGCYRSAPVAMIVPLRGGGTAVVCTKGDGSMDGWRPPVYPAGAPVGASLNLPRLDGYQMNGNGTLALTGATTLSVPQGYKTAWKDDRLNPERSLGTAQGRADQNAVWSQQVPAQQIAAAKPAKVSAKTTVSTNTNAAAATGVFYVQVGTFGVAANADGAAAQLSALGLPAAKSSTTSKGKAVQIVFAGPFSTKADAQAALSAARNAGFTDALIR